MIIDCIQKICQLKKCKRWQLVSRVKNFIKFKQLKKQCLEYIMSNNFIGIFPDICIGYHHIISGLNIKAPTVRVGHIYNGSTSFMINYDNINVSEIDGKVNVIVWHESKDENDRIRVRVSPVNAKNTKSYDIYIYLDTEENYSMNKLKGSILHSLVLYTIGMLDTLLDQVYKKYIGGDYDDDKKEV